MPDKKTENILTSDLPRRPPSSLSKFRVLPGINVEDTKHSGKDFNEVDIMTSEAQQMILDSSIQPTVKLLQYNQISSRSADKRKIITKPTTTKVSENSSPSSKKTKLNSHKKTNKSIAIKTIPQTHKSTVSEIDTQINLLLAIKLPDGKRIQQCFLSSNTLWDVMLYVQTLTNDYSIEDLSVHSMQTVPKVLLDTWNSSLGELGIKNRTVLYIDVREE